MMDLGTLKHESFEIKEASFSFRSLFEFSLVLSYQVCEYGSFEVDLHFCN